MNRTTHRQQPNLFVGNRVRGLHTGAGAPPETDDPSSGPDSTRQHEITPAAATKPRALYIIAGDVPDLDTLRSGIGTDPEVLVLDADTDGLERIADDLAGQGEARFDAIHIISHGDTGRLQLGTATLSVNTLAHYQPALAAIRRALTQNGDLLLYGCNLAQGEGGQAFVEKLAQITGADVSASVDITGAGGDWDLEARSGTIEEQPLPTPLGYQHALLLQTFAAATAGKLWSTMAEFAVAAYEDDGANTVRSSLLESGSWQAPALSFTAQGSEFTYGDGYYKCESAGVDWASAFVARCGDTLVLSFTGTDDNVDLVIDVLDMSIATEALHPLIDAIDQYTRDSRNGIRQVYVTGHSLGGALTQAFMLGHPDTATLEYHAITFGSAGFNPGVLAAGIFLGLPGAIAADFAGTPYDRRVVQLEATEDPVADALPTTGRTVHVSNSVEDSWNTYSLLDHAKTRYLAIAKFLDSELIESSQFAEGRGFDTPQSGTRILMPITGSEGTGWSIGAGDDSVKDFDFAYDFDIIMGGIGDDALGMSEALDSSGANTLYGGAGNDVYCTDNTADVIVEKPNAGQDAVYSAVSYQLAANVEQLYLMPSFVWSWFDADIDGTGNALDNRIDGNAGANALYGLTGDDTLDGALGHDQIYGGAGNDILRAADGGDLLRGDSGNDSYRVTRVDYDVLFSLNVPTYTIFDESGSADSLFISDDAQGNLTGIADLNFRMVGPDLWIDIDIDLIIDDDDDGRIIIKNQGASANCIESLLLCDSNGVPFGDSFALSSAWSALLATGGSDWYRMSGAGTTANGSALAVVPGSGSPGGGTGVTPGGGLALTLDNLVTVSGQLAAIAASISYTVTPARSGAIELQLDLVEHSADAGEDKTYQVDVFDPGQSLLESFRINGDATFHIGVDSTSPYTIRLTNTGDTKQLIDLDNGKFSLKVKQADTARDYESEHNDWRADADQIRLTRATEGQLSNSTDVDWYKVVPAQVGALDLTFTDHDLEYGWLYRGSGDYRIEFTDAAGAVIETFDYLDHADSAWRVGVASTAAHYIKVSHDPDTGAVDTGWYLLTVNQAPTGIDYESEFNDSRLTADTAALGRTTEGQLSTAADQDWFKVTPTRIGALDLSFTTSINGGSGGSGLYRIEVADAAGKVLETVDVAGGYASANWRVGVASSDVHFVKVSHTADSGAVDTGRYQLAVSQAPSDLDYESEFNDNRATAEIMTLGRATEGQLSTATDQDWYQATPSRVGALGLTFTTSFTGGSGGSGLYRIEVTDSNGAILDTVDVAGGYANADWRVATASTEARYIKVSHDPSSGELDTGWYHLTVTSINNAPTVAQALPDQTLNEDTALSLTLPVSTFADPGDTLAYTATLNDGAALPAWLTFNAGTLKLSGTPRNADVGRYDVKIAATDAAGATVADVFALTVNNVNDAPRLVTAIADMGTNEDTGFSFTLPGTTFADDDAGDSLSLSAKLVGAATLPAWLTFNPASRTFSGTPTNADVGVYDIRVIATDKSLATAVENFKLTVINTNDAPITTASRVTAVEDTRFTFALANFPFGDDDAGAALAKVKVMSWPAAGTLQYNGVALGAFSEISAADIAAGRLTYVPAADATGSVGFNFAVSDGTSYSGTATLTINIAAVNDAPRFVAPLLDRIATTYASFQYQLPNGIVTDAEGDPIAYAATLADGHPLPAWLAFDPSTRLFSGMPGQADTGTVDVRVTASDWFGASATDVFALQVSPEHGATVATATTASVGLALTGLIDSGGDRDWFKLTLNAGVTYTISLHGEATDGRPALADPYLRLLDGNGVQRGVNDDGSSDTNDSLLAYTPTVAGVYYVEASGVQSYSGGYRLTIATGSPNLIVGGAGSDVLYGTPGSDTLNGGAGADVLIGGDGSDVYVVDNVGDVVTETNAKVLVGGTDQVNSSLPSYTLGANVEWLALTGTRAISGLGNDLANKLTGNSLANSLTGGAGNDTLNGGTGADTLIGGLGSDTYVVDNPGDVVTEMAGQGTDTVQAGLTWGLGAGVEHLLLTGNAAINGSGNGLANTLTGNGSANRLDGGAGNDVLTGGAGSDTFRFVTTSEGPDNLTDFTSGADRIEVVSANFGGLPVGRLAASGLVKAGTPLKTGTAVFIYNAATGALSFDSNGSGAGGVAQIATLTGPKTLVARDIQLVAA